MPQKHFLIKTVWGQKVKKKKKTQQQQKTEQKIVRDWKIKAIFDSLMTGKTKFGIHIFQNSPAWGAEVQERKEKYWSYLILPSKAVRDL